MFVAELAGRGYQVVLVGPQSDLAPDAGAREKLPAVQRLRTARNVTIQLGASVEAIEEAI